MNNIIIRADKLAKAYHDGNRTVHVLREIDLSILEEDKISIVGPSGSGKSTLLHVLGGLDKPTTGQVLINDTNWQALTEKRRCFVRNRELGFVYQFHHLLPEFTALENVAMPLLLSSTAVKTALGKANNMLDAVGLAARKSHKPSELSGGERQRVAIARALVHKPRCVFADEPTGNLDQVTAAKIFELMLELNKEFKTALVIVTHDLNLASRMDKVLSLQDGRLG